MTDCLDRIAVEGGGAVGYVIDGERRLVQAALSGVVKGREIALTVEAVYSDPDWRPGFDIIWNCAAVSELIFGPDDVEALVAARRRLAEAGGGGRDIIVIKSVLDEGMARMYAAMRAHERRRTHLCASERTALEIVARYNRDTESK